MSGSYVRRCTDQSVRGCPSPAGGGPSGPVLVAIEHSSPGHVARDGDGGPVTESTAHSYLRIHDEETAADYLRTGVWTDQPFHARIAHFASTTPTKSAVTDEATWTYSEFHDYVLRLARTLLDLGVEHGEVVVVQSTNTVHVPALHAALGWIGAVMAPVSSQWRDAEMLPLLSTSRAVLLVHPTDISYDHAAAAASYLERVESLREAITLDALDDLAVQRARSIRTRCGTGHRRRTTRSSPCPRQARPGRPGIRPRPGSGRTRSRPGTFAARGGAGPRRRTGGSRRPSIRPPRQAAAGS